MTRVVGGGKYRLVRKIGAGGMGEVWVAVNRTTGAEVAVKLVGGAARREDAIARFRHEARLGAMLSHRSIVRIFDLVEDEEGSLVLVMELLRGETLERYRERRGPLPAREALAIVLPLLSALAHAHAMGVVHRDVTPANVLLALDPDGFVTPKLLDFGIAKTPAAADRHTVDGHALGTPRYMAPERVRDQGTLDGRSDLFSVAVVLYEMLTGVCPFAASSPAASLAAVLEAVVDPDPQIDARLWIELRRALAKQPYERPASAQAMAEGLLAASGETEASLAEALRAARIVEDAGGEAAAERTRTVGGHSMGAVQARGGRRIAWVVALGAFAIGASIALLRVTLGGSSASPAALGSTSTAAALAPSPPSAAPRTSPAAPSSSPGATTTAPVTPPEAAVPSPSAAPPASPPSPPTAGPRAPAPHRRHPKPIATTPGF